MGRRMRRESAGVCANGYSCVRAYRDSVKVLKTLEPVHLVAAISHGAAPVQSRSTTLRSELLILSSPLYSMNPSFRNLFMKKFTRDRVVPTISASVS